MTFVGSYFSLWKCERNPNFLVFLIAHCCFGLKVPSVFVGDQVNFTGSECCPMELWWKNTSCCSANLVAVWSWFMSQASPGHFRLLPSLSCLGSIREAQCYCFLENKRTCTHTHTLPLIKMFTYWIVYVITSATILFPSNFMFQVSWG